MKKILTFLAVFGMLTAGVTTSAYAQEDEVSDQGETEQAEDADEGEEAEADAADFQEEAVQEEPEEPAAVSAGDRAAAVETDRTFHQQVKDTFIDGGVGFMSLVLVCLILGLALCIERIIYLNMATTNKAKLLRNVEDALSNGGVEAAKDVCRNTRGPIASIFYQGLERYDEGIDVVEKSVVSYGGVQMGLLEKGLSWISLFIALAPMLGFMGTVIGMISAFDAIAAENNISPGIVAGGIKIALIMTVSGLIVAIILQIFYNYIVSKVDGIVNDMEDASISLIDMLIRYRTVQK
jgi:biopolymer transport protein ExbB